MSIKNDRLKKEAAWLLKEKYGGIPNAAYEQDLKRLRQGEPLAYVIGWVDFLGARIELDSLPLIPRPETEWWVEQAIGEIRERESARQLRILDIYAGSGCIGIALLKHFPDSYVDFGEVDAKHLDQIRMNCEINGILSERYRVIQTDGFSNITQTYDHIFANPPYIDPALNNVGRSVNTFEPHLALYAKDGGLEHVLRLLSKGAACLSPSGSLYLEFSPEQAERIETEARLSGWTCDIRSDQYGKFRWDKFSRQNLNGASSRAT